LPFVCSAALRAARIEARIVAQCSGIKKVCKPRVYPIGKAA